MIMVKNEYGQRTLKSEPHKKKLETGRVVEIY